MVDLFQDKAQNWDKGNVRTSTANAIADAIRKKIKLNNTMEILDFGVGTGLLGFNIAKDVKKVFGVDISPKMISKLKEKNKSSLSITPYTQDIIKQPLEQIFDGVISSMTLHHVEDLNLFFKTIYKNISKDGFLCIADLETEDGTFHSDNTGVFHFGFKDKDLIKIVQNAGFKDVEFKNISTIKKPKREFGIFLLSARKE